MNKIIKVLSLTILPLQSSLRL